MTNASPPTSAEIEESLARTALADAIAVRQPRLEGMGMAPSTGP